MSDVLSLILDENVPTENEFYEREEKDPNNFSFWYPKIKDLFTTPKTVNLKVPVDVAMNFADYYNAKKDPKVYKELQNFCSEVLSKIQDTLNSYCFFFMKNARFSDKFNFNDTCRCRYDAEDIERQFSLLNYDSMCVDALGFTEIVCRDYLFFDDRTVPTIYNGMPLRPEYRCFYDFDKKKLLHIHDYWDYDYVYNGLEQKCLSDRIVFKETKDKRQRDWNNYLSLIEEESKKLQNVSGLTGIWSVDFMIYDKATSGDRAPEKPIIYLIDMGVGQQSAYWYDCVKEAGLEN